MPESFLNAGAGRQASLSKESIVGLFEKK